MTYSRFRNASSTLSRWPAFLWIGCFGLLSFWGTVVYERVSRAEPGLLAEIAGGAGRPRLGRASWYGAEFDGLPTASGEIFDMRSLTAAHRDLPLGSRARVRNLENGREVEVRITDRGPFVLNRVIDLSYAAADKLGMVADGTARVEVVPLD